MDTGKIALGHAFDGVAAAEVEPPGRAARWIAEIPKVALGIILLLAIANLLVGVVLRYAVSEITDYLDLMPVSFFWVEEVGELLLAWLTFVGAGIGVVEGSHFTLHVLTDRLSPGPRRALWTANHVMILLFGVAAGWQGWLLTLVNQALLSPGLSISLGWLYLSSAVGGAMIAIYSIAAIIVGPAPPELNDVFDLG